MGCVLNCRTASYEVRSCICAHLCTIHRRRSRTDAGNYRVRGTCVCESRRLSFLIFLCFCCFASNVFDVAPTLMLAFKTALHRHMYAFTHLQQFISGHHTVGVEPCTLFRIVYAVVLRTPAQTSMWCKAHQW